MTGSELPLRRTESSGALRLAIGVFMLAVSLVELAVAVVIHITKFAFRSCAEVCDSVLQAFYDRLSNLVCIVALPVAKRLLVIPTHIYFVMDGNRRWAKARGKKSCVGHLAGYRTLERMLQVISKLGVKEVTVYAFSIPNFNRGEDEKNYLMDLATAKLGEMLRHGDVIERYDLCVRVVGKRELLPERLLAAAEKVERETRHRAGCRLNIAFAYASHNEIEEAVHTAMADDGTTVADGLWVPPPSPTSLPPLFVRTSGEMRFSDFLVWQSSFAHLTFQHVLWPDYRAWHFFYALAEYSWYFQDTASTAPLDPMLRPGKVDPAADSSHCAHIS